jgi:hypothetical protein
VAHGASPSTPVGSIGLVAEFIERPDGATPSHRRVEVERRTIGVGMPPLYLPEERRPNEPVVVQLRSMKTFFVSV